MITDCMYCVTLYRSDIFMEFNLYFCFNTIFVLIIVLNKIVIQVKNIICLFLCNKFT